MSKNPLIQQVGDTFTPQANLNKMSSLGAGVRNLKQGIALGCTMAWKRLKMLFTKKDSRKQRREFVGPRRLLISQVPTV